MSNTKSVMSIASNTWAGPTFIEDVFSTYLYTGNSSTQTITNGIDLAGEGGLVWIKSRSDSQSHELADTVRGNTKFLRTNSTSAERTSTSGDITAFTSSGFDLGNSTTAGVNSSGNNYASWTFRKAPRWFDVVTYTGNDVSGRQIPHNLGVSPGCIIIKNLSGPYADSSDWSVYHRSLNNWEGLLLNKTNAASANNNFYPHTSQTDTVFTVTDERKVNNSQNTYVAYLFAHDPLGPSEDGSDGLIACGSYTGTGAAGNFQDLGWEPQYVLVKSASASGNWIIHDVMRGMSETTSYTLKAESSSSENLDTPGRLLPRPTGFEFSSSGLAANNASGVTYIYIAIRRGPMRQPENGTEVFATDIADGSGSATTPEFVSGFPVDAAIIHYKTGGSFYYPSWRDRLRGTNGSYTFSGAAETADGSQTWDFMNGHFKSTFSSAYLSWMFRRAPGFFDVVAYTGTGANPQTHEHNLGVAPEMIIIKRRDSANDWIVYHSGNDVDGDGQPWTDYLRLDSNQAGADAAYFSDYQPTSVNFQAAGLGQTGASGGTYIAYLFATLPGVSKVGSYTGNGTNQTINCGFTSGARFILIKRTDSTGDWYVWDTARGIVAGNDPHLSLNTTAAEVTTDDTIDPDSSGFIVNQVSATNVNVSSATYIFLAIA